MMTETASAPGGPPQLDEQIEQLRPRDVAVALLTYNNAATAPGVVEVAREGLDASFPGAPAALIEADAGSADGTPERLAQAGLPAVIAQHQAPIGERASVPFHGVPGRSAALRLAFTAAQRLGVRVLIVLEADVTSITPDWIGRLAGPVWEDKADLVLPVHARHRYDGTITNLALAPLVRALFGRRLHQSPAGAMALSARLVEHLVTHPRWNWSGRDISDLWMTGTAIADGFTLNEAWLGRRRVESKTRTTDLPTVLAETLGAIFTVMDRHPELWLDVRGSEPPPVVGEPTPLATEPMTVDTERMIGAFRLGLRDLGSIWEHIMAPDTLGDVLALEAPDGRRFRFPDDLWARVLYDFALGHHYGVVHRDHLVRSIVPLYLGRTASFVLMTRDRDARATEAAVEAVGVAFERQKTYLVERWR